MSEVDNRWVHKHDLDRLREKTFDNRDCLEKDGKGPVTDNFARFDKQAEEIMKDKDVASIVMDEAKAEDKQRKDREMVKDLDKEVISLIAEMGQQSGIASFARLGYPENKIRLDYVDGRDFYKDNERWKRGGPFIKYNSGPGSDQKIEFIPIGLNLVRKGLPVGRLPSDVCSRLSTFVEDFKRRHSHNPDVKIEFYSESGITLDYINGVDQYELRKKQAKKDDNT